MEASKTKPGGVTQRRIGRWVRPPEGMLKLNCDASYYQEEGCGGWGFIIGDNDGDVVLSGWGASESLGEPFASGDHCLFTGSASSKQFGNWSFDTRD
ncbi:hypothetical protein BDA96_07G013300 [Sorghum bicolor]|uniref:RNase H type-1 domain-containing protein n=1 Tax=Sorghum bicolor TaxID=4558 RepID=A0A921QKF9_SORBI|nr:hypothetical protein BDA96_07G013300 [Sorghum bicolor]